MRVSSILNKARPARRLSQNQGRMAEFKVVPLLLVEQHGLRNQLRFCYCAASSAGLHVSAVLARASHSSLWLPPTSNYPTTQSAGGPWPACPVLRTPYTYVIIEAAFPFPPPKRDRRHSRHHPNIWTCPAAAILTPSAEQRGHLAYKAVSPAIWPWTRPLEVRP